MTSIRQPLRALLGRAGLRRLAPPDPPALGAAVLSARGLVLRYGRRVVLDGVAVDVHAGEILALVGPNGAGKSTLLGVLSGDITPAAGHVELYGRPLADWTAPELALRRAVLPQHTAVSFPFSVGEIVAMGRAPWAAVATGADTDPAAEDAHVVAAAMAATDVTHLADRQFPTLSGGERARVALARVLAQRAPVMLLDEPTAALDLRHQELVLRTAAAHAASGDAVCVVLHDLGLAAAYADRVAVLSDGHVAACGPPAEVFSAALLSEVYQHQVEVWPHPRTGTPLVVPER